MKLKKLSALLGLLSILLMALHVLYSIFEYFTFYYNPVMIKVFAIPFVVIVCLHAIFGMLTVFTRAEGGRADLYGKLNRSTILQRVSAALIFPLLILHIRTFPLMHASAEAGQKGFVLLLILGELLFFATVFTHISCSFTKGLITLGLLESREFQKKLDTMVYIINGLLFVIASFVIIKGQIGMYLAG